MTTKHELVKFYAEYNNIINLKEAEDKVDKFLNILKISLSENESIIFRKFGSFEVRKTTERLIISPLKDKKIIHAKPRKYVKFKVSKKLENELCLEINK